MVPIIKNCKTEYSENYQPASSLLTFKIMEQIVLEPVSKHVDDREEIRENHHGLTKLKPCLINLVAFYN